MRSDVPQEKYVGRAALQARLLRLYPRAWRERYGDEVLALIEQSGGGLRCAANLMAGAVREWVRSIAGRRDAHSLAQQSRRALVFYGMALMSTVVAQFFPPRSHAFALGEPVAQVSIAALFLSAAAMCWLIERAVFRLILRSRATAGEAFTLCALTFVLTVVSTRLLSETLPADLLPDQATFGIVVMFAEWFARPALVQMAMSSGDQSPQSGGPVGVSQ